MEQGNGDKLVQVQDFKHGLAKGTIFIRQMLHLQKILFVSSVQDIHSHNCITVLASKLRFFFIIMIKKKI